VVMELQGRYLVGAAETIGNGPMLYDSAAPALDVGPVGQRQRLIVLASEIAGAGEAHDRLLALEQLVADERELTAGEAQPFDVSPEQAAVQEILATLYPEPPDEVAEDDPPIPPVSELTDDQRQALEKGLGWFGRLAMAPRGGPDEAARDGIMSQARRTFVVALTAVTGAGIVGVLGFFGIVVLIILGYTGRLRGGLRPGAGHDGIYAETFALWLVVFIGLQLGVGAIAGMIKNPSLQMLPVAGAFFLSLVTLAWPVLRGVRWSDVRADIGWTTGRNPLLEVLIGLAGYAMTLPLLAVGIGLTYVLMMVDGAMASDAPTFDPVGGPAHPVVLEVARGDFTVLLQVLLLGSVAAPIIEETMFRGVLYRHLRDAIGAGAPAMSVVLATIVNTFVFAIIHPQGWVAVPALMSLAIGFTLAREWRGTLIPAMVMHGLSNGLVMCMLRMILA
ncbi:MAG: CPBP family intramembrane metalloprotease, partial [Planctomycetes bacterium]|nr:CPBP family intramembrane metalloprotease [Planctomycetota bacterium]